MGVASYSEDIWLRWSEAADPIPDIPLTVRFPCPFCSEILPSEVQRLAHLAAVHRGEAPELFIRGRRLGLEDRIRERLKPSDIAVSNCTYARISVNGGAFAVVAVDALPKLIVSKDYSLLDLALQNSFDPNVSPVNRLFRIRVRIPRPDILRAVDAQFRAHFIEAPISWDAVTRFRASRGTGGGEDYRNALANYVQGVLIRDQIPGTRVERDRAREVFNNALEELRGFERPLAQLITGIIRFADNDFGDPLRRTGWTRLDRARAVLAEFVAPEWKEGECSLTDTKVIAICPTDHGIDTVLDINDQLASKQYWSPHLTEELEARATASRLDPRERAKIMALWAHYALDLRAIPSAMKPLHEMIGDPVFGNWAEGQIQRLQNGR